MDIEVRLLRSFVATYEHGSVSRAAEKLACTQAAMSMRLKMLEGEVGGELFLRRHHRLEPTSRGSELYAKALTVLAAYDELLSTSRSRAPLYRIRIGVPDDYALGLLSSVLRRFTLELADVELEILCDLSANLYASLHRQDLDIALATLAARPPSARLAIEARLHWIHHGDFIGPDDEGGIALAAYPEGCVFRRAMIGALEKERRRWRVAVQSRSHAGVIAAVRAGAAVTSMAAGTAPDGLNETAATDWLPALDPVPIYLISLGKDLNPAARRLEGLIHDELERAFAVA